MKSNVSSKVLDVVYGKFTMNSFSWDVFDIDDGFTTITGYTREDLTREGGLSMRDFIPSEDLEIYSQKVSDVLSKKPECYLKHRIVKKSGEVMYVLCFGRMVSPTESQVVIADVTEMVNYEAIVKDVKCMLDTVVENVPCGIAIYEIFDDKDIRVTLANDYFWKKLGYESEDDLIMSVRSENVTFSDEDYAEIVEKIQDIRDGKLSYFENEYKLTKQNGFSVWISLKFKLYQHSVNNAHMNPQIYAVMSDITSLKEQLATIRYQNERYELIQDLTSEIYFDYDLANDTLTLPKNVQTNLTGNGKGNVIRNFFEVFTSTDIIHDDDRERFFDVWEKAVKSNDKDTHGSVEFRIKLYDDDYMWCNFYYMSNLGLDGNTVGLFGKIVDTSENHSLKDELRHNKNTIEFLSSKDTITKLENKTSFAQKFDKIIPTLDVDTHCCAIVSSDINDFSYVNDNFGYDAGNDTLVEYAKVISQEDMFILNCRVYSDYFYCLAYGDFTRDELVSKVKNVHGVFTQRQREKYPAGDISICSGIFFIENNRLDSIICMDNCNLARRSIKNDKSNDIATYSEMLRDNRSREKTIQFELNEAIRTGQIEVFLQPKFDMKNFKIIGAEALSRWRNPDGSYRSPVTFIPQLEKLGHVVQLDFYIYEQVLKVMRKWKDDGIKLIPISINFSRIHNNYSNFVDRVLSLANKYGIDKSLIEIEITESAFAKNDNVLLGNIRQLRELGFKIDIDDFGIGESSLSTLLDAPVDIIKLDKKFIDDLQLSECKQKFVKQLCLLIQTSNKNIVFEGVELQNQADFLCNCGFYMAQGWLFDKAIRVPEFEKKYIY